MKRDPVTSCSRPDRVASWFLRTPGTLAIVVVFGLLFNTLTVLTPMFQGRLIDAVATGLPLPQVVLRTMQFFLFVALVQGARYLKRFFVRRFANLTNASMRHMIYNDLLHRSAAELDFIPVGDLMTRAVGDVDLCVEGMRKATTEVFDSGVLVLSYAVVMCTYDIRLTLLSCAFVPVAMLIAQKLKTVVYRFSSAYRAKSSEVAGLTYETVTGALLLRVNGLEEHWAGRYGEVLSALQACAIRSDLMENAMQPVYKAVASLGVAAVIVLGGQRVLAGSWSIGAFSAYLTMFLALATKAGKTAKLFNSVQKARISWKRIQPYLREYQAFPPRAAEAQPEKFIVNSLSFRYDDGTEDAVSDISLAARPGQLIGVTGPVACGKSAFGIALLGLYPYGGSIRFGGCEIRDIPPEERSRRIAYMGHDAQLLSGTIYENVTLGDGGDILPVLETVCFLEDMRSMPEGIHTRVGAGGTRLSGGQQARLALARTLYRGSPVLILDDPFAAVDKDTERRIIANLRAHYADRIILLISHRLAVFPLADEALLMEHGRLTARGTHEELLEKSGLYREICRLQEGDGA